MHHSEAQFIELCKRQLEEKFSFGNGHGYTQKDLEQLSDYIEEKKGVYISLSTLKRIWKNDFKQGPQLATLNSLVSVLDYENWQEFKIRNKKSLSAPLKDPNQLNSFIYTLWKPGLVVVTIIASISWIIMHESMANDQIEISQPVIFEADKTLITGVPNTAIFKYDVSGIKADSFFIQQSWNKWRRKRIDPGSGIHTSLYYESGFHRAKLIANDSIIAMQPIHIISDGWEPHVYYSESDQRFIDFHDENIINDGALNLSKRLLQKKEVDTSRDFYTRVTNSTDFNLSSDNFHFTTRVKLDAMTKSNCPWLICQIVTEKHIFYVKLINKGCELFGAYKLGEVIKQGENNDLSALGQNVFDWQEIEILVEDKYATVLINGAASFSELFQEDFGKIMGLSYVFDGKGSIDFVQLKDGHEKVVFEEEFEMVK